MNLIKKLADAIDWLTDRVGRIVSVLILALIVSMTYEVAARYLFNAPTKWSYDLSYMIGDSMMLLGTGYALLHGAHVRVDLLYERFPTRVKYLIDTVLICGVFFPLVGILTHRAFRQALVALERGTRSDFGIWMPLMWPFRFALAIGFALLLIAGISWLLKCVIGLKEEVSR